MGGGGYYVLA